MEAPYELLIKYCRKQTSPEENRQVENWLSEGDNHSLFLELKKEWILIDEPVVIPDKHVVWEKIQARIARSKSKLKRVKLFRIMAVASVIAVIVMVSSIVYYFGSTSDNQSAVVQYATVNTKTSEKKEIVLMDETKIWLNSNSSLSYNGEYNVDQREVTVEGEFFFEVTPSSKKFIVNTGKIRIEVLGTSFNLKAVANEDIEISLKEGKIAVFNSKENKQMFIMAPSQRAIINKDDLSYVLETENDYISDVWKEKTLEIYDESLRSILNKLEIWYDMEIICTGLDLNKHYTFQLENENLQEFLELFSAMTPVQYTINGRKLYIEAITTD